MGSLAEFNKFYHQHQHHLNFPSVPRPLFYGSNLATPAKRRPKLKLTSPVFSSSSSSDKGPKNGVCEEDDEEEVGSNSISRLKKKKKKKKKKKRVFFYVNPLCYSGNIPSLHSFAHWISLFFSQVSLSDPVISVMDGERGNEHRRQLLPSYKVHRRKFAHQFSVLERFPRNTVGRSHKLVLDVLHNCNVPVVKIEAHEADDVVVTLVGQVLSRGYRVVIASPDKDFKQLISEDVQIVMPIPEIDRWSFYTIKHYLAQYNCEPQSDLSLSRFLAAVDIVLAIKPFPLNSNVIMKCKEAYFLKREAGCILGDEVDGVPGIQHFVPGFGRKTAIMLLKKHGSFENLLSAAAVRTVGRQYAQNALKKYADHLRRNYEVLSLKRDVDLHIEEQWLSERDSQNDSVILSNSISLLRKTQDLNWQSKYWSND